VIRSKNLQTEFLSNSVFFQKIIGRAELELISPKDINEFFESKRIMIIGAGGTIGSAVARRLVNSQVKDVYFLDRDESALHALALSLSDKAASHSELCVVADIKDFDGLNSILSEYKPDVIIHAAALKHLVIVERFPREAYITNVLGTLNVLEAAKINKVSQVINISTDKAANPTSNLGKTKRITELLVNEYSNSKNLNCCSVRFGNVFASRGSVIETFMHQIQNNLPVTLTDQNVSRYFMSHDEAANLILASVRFEQNGIFVQNMGKEIMMSDVVESLAENLGVKHSVRLIGLQPGEKLHEELYAGDFEQTTIKEIVKVKVKFKSSLVDLVQFKGEPKDNKDALKLIDEILNQ
jgi:FlaA1/EpsC-like NDP-sugar epimerase